MTMPNYLTAEERERAATVRAYWPPPAYRYHYRIGVGGAVRMLVVDAAGAVIQIVDLSQD